ncbi:radical SAM protein [Ruminiclostridium herbifermentans]|uniref:Radical SAM protein n=1 Tax=Ruminiclostridium herbifermentans TaxID=2488810 RepID=A0A4U7JJV8_9FIRM|nr:radical SAM protein [Ruminiclostridium herbifermentans]QNU66243.1 radical SAM protein [Ruminiclostridium herbifermentans]
MKNLDCLLIGYTGNNLELEKSRILAVSQKPLNIENPFNLAIAYLGTLLDKLNISFQYIVSFEDDQKELIKKMQSHKFKAIAISTTFCINIDCVRNMVKIIRNIDSNVKIIIGGYFIAARIKQLDELERKILFKKIGADIYINSFYGESTLGEIILALKSGGDLNKIDNIYYKDKNKYHTKEAISDEYNIKNYNINWSLFEDKLGTYVPIRTSVSCPFSCNFCIYSQNTGKHRQLDILQVEDELKQLKRIGKTKIINFTDSTFNVPMNRYKELLRMLIRNKFEFKWHSFARCQYLDEEAVSLMKESGCQAVHLGFESGNQEMLNVMNKSAKIQDYIRGHSLLKKYNIMTTGLFFIGFPGETLSTVKDTVNFINNIRPDYYFIQPWIYDHSTSIANQAEKYELKGSMYNWSHKTMNSELAIKLAAQLPKIIKSSTMRNMDTTYFYQLLNAGFTANELKEIEEKLNEIKYKDIIVDEDILNYFK